MPCPLAVALEAQQVWTNKAQFVDAERNHHTKPQNESESEVKTDEPVASASSTSNTKKSKKNKKAAADASPSDPSESQALDNSQKSSAADKKQKNDKNAKKQKQQTNKQNDEAPVAPEKSAPETVTVFEETLTDDAKQSAKAKKQKAKKDNKKAAKKNQQVDDSNKSNVSSISEDVSLGSEKRDAAKAKQKPDATKATKNKVNAKNEAISAKSVIDDSESVNNKVHVSGGVSEECTLVSEIAKARQHLKNSLERMDDIAALAGKDVLDRISALEKENASLRHIVDELKKLQLKSEDRIKSLESRLGSAPAASAPAAAAPKAAAPAKDDDDDVDLFGSDSEEEDDAAAKVREQRLAEYAAKKSKKPALIAKSNVILDVKPWDDETDMKKMEEVVRKIECDGLLWGTARLVPLAFGIHKLTISCVVEDEKVSIDWLTEEIEKNDEYVQSVDVAAFNKI